MLEDGGKLVLDRYYYCHSGRDMISAESTKMFAEAAQSAAVAAHQLTANAALMRTLGRQLRRSAPTVIYTCARGSSDHAATFAKYMFETRLRVATVSQAPSISSIYGGPLLHMAGAPFIVISQSGRSPDLLLSARAARDAGAQVIALVNDTGSPLAELAEIVVPLHAGRETSVAATKSYIATLVAIAHVCAEWGEDRDLLAALDGLAVTLDRAWSHDWSAAQEVFAGASSAFVLGRGLTLGIAQEAALKFKETCGLHAEAFSIAEVAHGPMALVKPGFPLLVFPPFDQARLGLAELLADLSGRGARIVFAGQAGPGLVPVPVEGDLHPALAPITMIQSFYRMINALSVARGYDPDHPPHLNKVTRTR
jgi:glutamine---fructose-6-phosphate transaminase (isomerizing)